MTKLCPLLKKECIEHQCEWYINILGLHPQTGETINDWRCAISFLPVLLVENSKEQRGTAASCDKIASQIFKSRSEFIGALPPEAKNRLVEENVRLLENGSSGK